MNVKQAKKILKQFDYRLIKRTKNCVGTGIVYKNNKYILQIYLKKQLNSHRHLLSLRFGKEAKLVKDKELPNTLKPELVETEFHALARTDKFRPCPGGVSIGHVNITAGTFGCVVYKDNEGVFERYILSNNHVLANSNAANLGDNILQPGPIDGGTYPDDKIGELEDYETILFNNPDGPYNLIDAAICKPTIESDILDRIIEQNGLPSLVRTTEYTDENELVMKTGRTTGTTEGQIIGFSGIIAVYYGIPGIAYYDDQILTDAHMGAGGDSGSLLMSICGKRALGLLFAGSSRIVIYNRAPEIESTLGITFAPRKRCERFQFDTVNRLIQITAAQKKIMMRCCCECYPSEHPSYPINPPGPPDPIVPDKYYYIQIKNYSLRYDYELGYVCDEWFEDWDCCIKSVALAWYYDHGGFVPYNTLCEDGGNWCSKIVFIAGPFDSLEDCENTDPTPFQTNKKITIPQEKKELTIEQMHKDYSQVSSGPDFPLNGKQYTPQKIKKQGCCGKAKAIAEGFYNLKRNIKLPNTDHNIAICETCEHHTWLSQAEYNKWLLKNRIIKVLKNFRQLEKLPPLAKYPKSEDRGKMFCRLCKCYIEAKARSHSPCTLGKWQPN